MASRNTSLLQGEPTLEDLFEEPIVQLVMQRGGVTAHDLRAEINRLMASYGASCAGEPVALS